MENRLSKILKSLAEIKKVCDLRDYSDCILFQYSGLYFYVYVTEGLGKLDKFAHIVLANCIEIEEKHIEVSKDILFHTITEFEDVRLCISNENNIIIHSQIDCEDSRLTKKTIKSLKDILAAKDFFTDNYLMMTTIEDEKIIK